MLHRLSTCSFGDLIMALLRTSPTSAGWFTVAAACGNVVHIAMRPTQCSATVEGGPSGTEVVSHTLSCDDPSVVKAVEFSPSGNYLVVCSEGKKIKLWTAPDCTTSIEREIPRRATAVQFTRNEEFLLISDKTGEVLRYTIPQLEATDGLLLGHSSMLLDIRHCSRNGHEFVISCDRDEKIRVSHFPNGYNIQTFCLGHTELVSRLCLCSQFPGLLLSGSGDGTLRVWDWYQGTLLHTEKCSDSTNNSESNTVFDITCSHSRPDPIVVVAIDKLRELKVYSLLASGHLEKEVKLALSIPAVPWSCTFDHQDRLWVCMPDEQEPVLCFRFHNGKFSKVSDDEEPLLPHICKWEYFKGCTGKETDWSELRKHEFDNMSSYLAKKQERLDQKIPAKLKAISQNCKQLTTDSALFMTEDIQRPLKLPKLD